jgi:hypothetical protein
MRVGSCWSLRASKGSNGNMLLQNLKHLRPTLENLDIWQQKGIIASVVAIGQLDSADLCNDLLEVCRSEVFAVYFPFKNI